MGGSDALNEKTSYEESQRSNEIVFNYVSIYITATTDQAIEARSKSLRNQPRSRTTGNYLGKWIGF
jgi:hypothetical protein